VLDFVAASALGVSSDGRMTFDAWARQVFGDGIAESFLLPYNSKIFGLAPTEFTAEWATWSAPRPDLRQVIRGALGIRNTDLGYNPRFWYPRAGGIGALSRALAARVAADLRCDAEVAGVDLAARTVTSPAARRCAGRG